MRKIGNLVISDKQLEAGRIILDYYTEDYIYWGIVVLPRHVHMFGIDELVSMAQSVGRDVVSVKYKGDIEGIRFVEPQYVPTERHISRDGNGQESTLGDGLYMYDINSDIIKNRVPNGNKIPIYLKATNVDYYRIIAYNDGDKSNEILIAPGQTAEVIKIFNDINEYKSYSF